MAITIEMPKLSDTMSEGKILSWKKKEGDPVQAGEILAEIESDKANMEMEAYDSGYIRRLLVAEGEAASVGAPIAILTEKPDEDISALPSASSRGAAPAGHGAAPAGHGAGPASAAAPAPAPASQAPAGKALAAAQPASRKVIASPLAFRMAAELGISLSTVTGSGPEGRIVKRDVERLAGRAAVGAAATPAALAAREAPTAWVAQRPLEGREPREGGEGPAAALPFTSMVPVSPAGPLFEDVPLSTMRKIIAERLTGSVNTAPHFYVTVEVDMKAAIAAREQLKQKLGVEITFTDVIVRAVAICLVRHPAVNASWRGDFVRYHRSADVAVAVSIPDGLITPVVRGCHSKGLGQISMEIKALAERARQKKLTPDEYKGSTFTVSNLGMYGVAEFTGILNPPEACLLAVGGIRSVPVVEGEAVVPGKRMSVTLSCDHRVVDGAQAALFLKDFREILENPLALAL